MSPAIAHAPDIEPERIASGVAIRTLLATSGAAGPLTRRLVEIPPGACFAGTAGAGGELWFVISGGGGLELDERTGASGEAGPPAEGVRLVQVGEQQGLRLPAGAGYRLRADEAGPIQLDVVALPLPAGPAAAALREGAEGGSPALLVSDLSDCAVEITGDRRFRVVFGPGRGCSEATQFVGEIPPGRAPVHSHTYDEVVLILAGEGVVHIDGTDHPLAPGTCVHLSPGQRHCLENTGPDTLVVLGVFHPGGSPAAKHEAPRPAS
jgi:mannose-6-phosphate isomerase-like protein (cupin superfamily)